MAPDLAILDDVKGVTSTVKEDAARVDGVVRWIFGALQRCRLVVLPLAGSILFSTALASRAFAGPELRDGQIFSSNAPRFDAPVVDVERRGLAIDEPSRVLHLADLTVLRLEGRLVKLRFAMIGVTPQSFPSAGPRYQAVATVRVNVVVLPSRH